MGLGLSPPRSGYAIIAQPKPLATVFTQPRPGAAGGRHTHFPRICNTGLVATRTIPSVMLATPTVTDAPYFRTNKQAPRGSVLFAWLKRLFFAAQVIMTKWAGADAEEW